MKNNYFLLLSITCLAMSGYGLTKKDRQDISELLCKPMNRMEQSVDSLNMMVNRMEVVTASMATDLAKMDEKYQSNQQKMMAKIDAIYTMLAAIIESVNMYDAETMEQAPLMPMPESPEKVCIPCDPMMPERVDCCNDSCR